MTGSFRFPRRTRAHGRNRDVPRVDREQFSNADSVFRAVNELRDSIRAGLQIFGFTDHNPIGFEASQSLRGVPRRNAIRRGAAWGMCNRALPACESIRPFGERRASLGTAGRVRRSVDPQFAMSPGNVLVRGNASPDTVPTRRSKMGARSLSLLRERHRDRGADVLFARIRAN